MTSVLLDTCVLIWLTGKPKKLSRAAVRLIEQESTELCLSDASVLEISLKYSSGKLRLPLPPRVWVLEQCQTWGIKIQPITTEIIFGVSELPNIHADPFDRLLVSTAVALGCRLISPDELIASYPVAVIW